MKKPVPVSQPIDTVIRVGDCIDHKIQRICEYGTDSRGLYAIVEFGEPCIGDHMYVKTIDLAADGDEDDQITFTFDEPMIAITPDVKLDSQLNLWGDDQKHEQNKQAMEILREIEGAEAAFAFVSHRHKARIKVLKLNLRQLVHGAFPAEDNPLFDDVELPTTKVDPATLPSPKTMSGDTLAAKAAGMHNDGSGRDAPALIDGQHAETSRRDIGQPKPGKKRAPIVVESIGKGSHA